MEILDTAGQDEFKSIRDIYYRTGDGFILVYSITDTNSLDDIEECVEGIMQTTVSELEQRALTFWSSIFLGMHIWRVATRYHCGE